ncbi:hypothetical protein BKA70DRAFT_1233801 [Coprinopsis sp. MPI-PUGE-AT-0042]|nr:hypothetical protein BKA70DRAFT_1233801 [Coprinopsis sp. MPI-PUGE-AT-0042]
MAYTTRAAEVVSHKLEGKMSGVQYELLLSTRRVQLMRRHCNTDNFSAIHEQDLATGVLATIDHDTSARAPEVVPASAAIAPPSLGEIIDPFTTDIGSLSHSQSGNGTSANDATLPEAAQRVTIALSRGHIQQAMEAQVTEKAPRKPRACMKCGLLGCSGRRNVDLCERLCRDCGKLRCLGRHPRELQRPCWEVQEKREKTLGKRKRPEQET